jgi:cGMP-dependent protein kinase
MENCVVQEKRILSKIVFPYIVGFVKSFHDEKNIYFLMEYLKGK